MINLSLRWQTHTPQIEIPDILSANLAVILPFLQILFLKNLHILYSRVLILPVNKINLEQENWME